MAVSQQDLDAITAGFTDIDTKVGDLTTTLTADDAALAAEIATLKAQGVDVTGLQAVQSDLSSKVSALGDAVTATTALVPATPEAGGAASSQTADNTESTETDPNAGAGGIPSQQ